MAATSKTDTWDAAWTLTGRARRKRLTDNISDSYPTIGEFRKKGILEVETGGKEIQEDLMYALNSWGWFDGFDILNTDAVDGITAAFYQFRYGYVPITISMTEETEARDAEGAMSLMDAKMKQSMITAFDGVNSQLNSAATGKSILGLQDLVSTSSGATVGGINSGTETWWDNSRVNYTTNYGTTKFAAKSTVYTDMYVGILAMRDLWNAQSEGNDTPDLCITDYNVYGAYEGIFEGTGFQRLAARDANAVDGTSPMYRGMKILPDRDAPYTAGNGQMRFLTTKFLKFKVQEGKNFAKTPFKEPANQLAKVAFVVLGAQGTTNHRARQGVLYNITAV